MNKRCYGQGSMGGTRPLGYAAPAPLPPYAITLHSGERLFGVAEVGPQRRPVAYAAFVRWQKTATSGDTTFMLAGRRVRLAEIARLD